MKAFIDFDGVLFNIAEAKKEYFRLFAKFGVPFRDAVQAYEEAKEELGYDEPSFHIELLKKRFPKLKEQALLKAIRVFKGRSKRFVYRESPEFLRALKRAGFELHLVTTGSRELQSQKVASSGLRRFFHNIEVLETEAKGETVRRFSRPARLVVFLDDRKVAIDDVKRIVPQALVIQIVRHAGEERSREADGVVSNLREALGYIKKLEHRK